MALHAKILDQTHLVDETGNVRLEKRSRESLHMFQHRACLYALEHGMSIDRFYGDHKDYPSTKEGWIRMDASIYKQDREGNLCHMFIDVKIIYASPSNPRLIVQMNKSRWWQYRTYKRESRLFNTEEEAREAMFAFMKQERLRVLL